MLAEVAAAIRALVAEPTEPVEIAAVCPFPGLKFFDEDRAADFFGREAQVSEALAQLTESRPSRRWLQIDGPSGAGKSSFARAGIVPAVRAGKLAGRGGAKAWVAAVMRPGHDPIASLAEALVKHAKPKLTLNGRDFDDVKAKLRGSPSALASLLREGRPDGHGVLLLVDQFEEAFTLAHADETGVKQFDMLLAAALDDREGPLVLVTTIRSDFVARMGEMPSLEGKLPAQAVRYYLRPMDEAGLRAAMEKPAEHAGLAYDEGLIDRIVADASASRGALPLVAHVLEALYARREGRTLTARAYDAGGGVGGALAKSADTIVDGLDEDGRVRARKLLLRLVKIGRGSEDTRQTAQREAAVGAAGGGPEAERVLARLSGGRAVGLGGTSDVPGRLVVVSDETGTKRVDLVHEALIQRWAALRAWIKDAREEMELRDDVEEAARIWEASGSAEDGLAKGAVLARFRGVERAALKQGARRYLDAAEASEQRGEQEMRAQEKGRVRQISRLRHTVIGAVQGVTAAARMLARVALDNASERDKERVRAMALRVEEDAELIRLWRENQRIYTPEAVKVWIRRQPLRPIVVKRINHFTEILRARGIGLTVVWKPEGSIDFAFDAWALDLVISNLLANAHKYALYNTDIEVGVESDGRIVRIWVEDVGHAVPERLARSIYCVSERLDWEGSVRHLDGIGLGLPIARALVEAHGGVIRHTSQSLGLPKVKAGEFQPHRVRFVVELPHR